MFKNRIDAAEQLADELKKYRNQNGVVLAIPRGGVPIGYLIARDLNMPLDVALSKKIGHPINKEYAIGSVSLQGEIINRDVAVPEKYIAEEIKEIRKSLQEKYNRYMGNRKPVDIKNKIVIIVDDGVATGSTLLATIDLIKRSDPKSIVVAVPVGPPETIMKINREVNEIVCLDMPVNFFGVGQFYEDFDQVSDDTVMQLLKTANNRALVTS